MTNLYIQQFNKTTDQLTKQIRRNKSYIQKKGQKWYYLQSFWIRIRYPINSLQTLTIFISSPVSWWSLEITDTQVKQKIDLQAQMKLTPNYRSFTQQTFKQANALTKDVFGIWGPRHRSTNGPHLYTVIVLSSGKSLMISIWLREMINNPYEWGSEK